MSSLILNLNNITLMVIREFRFEEFELMEYSLQLSFHTIALKMDFFNVF